MKTKSTPDPGLPDTLTPRHAGQPQGWRLYVIEEGALRCSPLPLGSTASIGRDPGCDLVLRDPAVSRRHALVHVGERVQIEDLGSGNGTEVAGQRLTPRRRHSLDPHSGVRIGSTTLLFAPAGSGHPTRPLESAAAAVVESESLRGLYQLAARVAA